MNTGAIKHRKRPPEHTPRATSLRFEDDRMVVTLADEREVSLPLRNYPTLRKAPPAQRDRWQLIGPDKGFYWEELDLDLAVSGLLSGLPEIIPPPPLPQPAESRTRENRELLAHWVVSALEELDGSAAIVDVSRVIWQRHAPEINAAGDLLYTWQYEIRWASEKLKEAGVLRKDRSGWHLSDRRKRA